MANERETGWTATMIFSHTKKVSQTNEAAADAEFTMDVSRRQLLKGVAASASISMLVTVPAARASASPMLSNSAALDASDILWMFGTSNVAEGYFAQGVAPDGSQVAFLSGLPRPIARSADGRYLVSVTAASQGPTMVTIYDATTGSVSKRFDGQFTWPSDPSLEIAIDPATGAIAVFGASLVSVPTGRYATKDALDGGTRQVAITAWKAFEGIEIFDLAGNQIGVTPPHEVELGRTTQIAHSAGRLFVVQQGPQRTSVQSSGVSAPGVTSALEVDPDLVLKHADREGRIYLLDDMGDVVIWSSAGGHVKVPLSLNSLASATARPYPVSFVSISDGAIAVVDASRQFLASVDAVSGQVMNRRTLGTSSVFSAPADSSGPAAAVDVARRRLYILDRSGVTGGVWVHDADTLEVLDRWHSDVMFRLVWVAQESGAVYLQANEGPVAVHDAAGQLVSFVPSDVATANAI